MNSPRAIQNFRGFRGVWWGSRNAAAEALGTTLGRLGLTFAFLDAVGVDGLAGDRDILFVDGDGVFDPAAIGCAGRLLPAVPVIGVVGVEAPSRLKALSDTGATAFLRKPIHPASVYSSLFLAVNNHARFSRLEARLAEHDRRRSGRRYVVKAMLALMQDRGLCDDEAYAQLRRDSMRLRLGLEDYARSLCNAADVADHSSEETDDAEDQNRTVGQRGDRAGADAEPGRQPRGRSHQTRRA